MCVCAPVGIKLGTRCCFDPRRTERNDSSSPRHRADGAQSYSDSHNTSPSTPFLPTLSSENVYPPLTESVCPIHVCERGEESERQWGRKDDRFSYFCLCCITALLRANAFISRSPENPQILPSMLPLMYKTTTHKVTIYLGFQPLDIGLSHFFSPNSVLQHFPACTCLCPGLLCRRPIHRDCWLEGLCSTTRWCWQDQESVQGTGVITSLCCSADKRPLEIFSAERTILWLWGSSNPGWIRWKTGVILVLFAESTKVKIKITREQKGGRTERNAD